MIPERMWINGLIACSFNVALNVIQVLEEFVNIENIEFDLKFLTASSILFILGKYDEFINKPPYILEMTIYIYSHIYIYIFKITNIVMSYIYLYFLTYFWLHTHLHVAPCMFEYFSPIRHVRFKGGSSYKIEKNNFYF